MSENQITKATITNPAYRAGQEACRDCLAKACEPNWTLARLMGADFLAGMEAEYDELTMFELVEITDPNVMSLAAFRLANMN